MSSSSVARPARPLQMLGLCIAAAAVPWGGAIVCIGVGVMLLGVLLARDRGDGFPPRIGIACLCLAVPFLVSGLLSDDLARGLYEVKGLWPLLVLLAGPAAVRRAPNPMVVPAVWLASAAVAASYALVVWLRDPEPRAFAAALPTGLWRFNLALAHGVVCGLYLLTAARARGARMAALGATVLVCSCFFLVGERMPVLLAGGLLLLHPPLVLARGASPRRVAAFAAVAVTLVAAALLANPQLSELVRMAPQEITEAENVRLSLWSTALDLFRESPLVGVGIGDAADLLHARMAEEHGLPHAPAVHAHSNLLHLMAAAGLMGAAGYLVWALLLILPWLPPRRLRTPAGFLCAWAWCFLVVWGVIEGTLFQSYFLAPSCLLYALGAGLWNPAREDQSPSRASRHLDPLRLASSGRTRASSPRSAR